MARMRATKKSTAWYGIRGQVLYGSVVAIKSLYDFKRTDAIWIRLTNRDLAKLEPVSHFRRLIAMEQPNRSGVEMGYWVKLIQYTS